MTAISIRAAHAGDAEDLAAIYADEAVIGMTGQIPLRGREFWRDFYKTRDPNGTELVAVVDNRVVGHLGTLANTTVRRKHIVSFGLCVHPAYQRRGVGRALLTTLLDLADRWLNTKRVELTVAADNAGAIALYEQLGFEHEGRMRRDSFRDGRYVDTLVMARLHPSLLADEG